MMTIHDVKNDPILQVSSQEPSMSSKFDSLSLKIFNVSCSASMYDPRTCFNWVFPK